MKTASIEIPGSRRAGIRCRNGAVSCLDRKVGASLLVRGMLGKRYRNAEVVRRRQKIEVVERFPENMRPTTRERPRVNGKGSGLSNIICPGDHLWFPFKSRTVGRCQASY